MGKNTYKALAIASMTTAVAFGMAWGVSDKGGQRAPDTFEIVTVDMSAAPEPSSEPTVAPTTVPPSVAGPRPSRTKVLPASPWASPEISAGGGQGGGGEPPVTPSSKPIATNKKG